HGLGRCADARDERRCRAAARPYGAAQRGRASLSRLPRQQQWELRHRRLPGLGQGHGRPDEHRRAPRAAAEGRPAMKRSGLLGHALLATLLVAGLSCGDSTGPSGPGQLKVRLTSANSGLDSAIVFTITGPAPLTSATAGTGLRLFQQPLGGTATRFAITGQLTNGATILTIGVANIG